MKNTRKLLPWLFGLAIGAALAAAILFYFLTPSARSKYERIRAGMTLTDVQTAVGFAGTEMHPGDTTGQYIFDQSEDFSRVQSEQVTHYWKFRDGLIIAQFGGDGAVSKKTFLRR